MPKRRCEHSKTNKCILSRAVPVDVYMSGNARVNDASRTFDRYHTSHYTKIISVPQIADRVAQNLEFISKTFPTNQNSAPWDLRLVPSIK